MAPEQAREAMAALAQATRLDAFVALGRALPAGLAVGRMAEMLDVPKNTMSSHLSILARAGLVEASRSGTTVTYKARTSAVEELALFIAGTIRGG